MPVLQHSYLGLVDYAARRCQLLLLWFKEFVDLDLICVALYMQISCSNWRQPMVRLLAAICRTDSGAEQVVVFTGRVGRAQPCRLQICFNPESVSTQNLVQNLLKRPPVKVESISASTSIFSLKRKPLLVPRKRKCPKYDKDESQIRSGTNTDALSNTYTWPKEDSSKAMTVWSILWYVATIFARGMS